MRFIAATLRDAALFGAASTAVGDQHESADAMLQADRLSIAAEHITRWSGMLDWMAFITGASADGECRCSPQAPCNLLRSWLLCSTAA